MGRHPLALHGVIVGRRRKVHQHRRGRKRPGVLHLRSAGAPRAGADDQEREGSSRGEALNLIVGGRPLGARKDAVKANVLKLLADKYGVEEGFLSAELNRSGGQGATWALTAA
ncbi:MAG: hypothetical protein ACLUI3_17670 [Christensenellales bacterium]